MTPENYFWLCPNCKANISASSPEALEIGIFQHKRTHGDPVDGAYHTPSNTFIVYTVEEVATALKCTVFTVRSLIKAKKLHAKKIGREYRILKEDLLDYMGLEEL